MQSRLLEALADRVLVYDGAMGTQIQARELTAEDFGGKRYEGCNDVLSLTRPDVVEAIHAAYFEAGADAVETNSFQASRLRLEEWGLGERTLEVNRAAAAIARRAADRFAAADGRPRFAIGSIGPSGMLPSSEDPDLGRKTLDDLLPAFAEQAQGLLEGGADALILETCQDILEMKAQVLGAREAMARTGRLVPIQCSVTLDPSGRMLLGTDIRGALATLEALRVDIIGLNCSTGPDLMRDSVRWLGQFAGTPIHCIPNAGLPINDGGRAHYPMLPGPMAETLREFVAENGVNIIGGCCGTTPEHTRAMVAAIGRRAPTRRPGRGPWAVSSGMTATALRQEPAPTIIGERLNTQGSRKVKALVLDDRLEDLVPIARGQVEGGAHTLDVCLALTERTDEAEQMRRLVRKLALSVEAPLCIDSTEAAVIEAALKAYPGCPIVNSINLENGRERIDAVMPLVMRYGAAVIALTIDEQGMAKSAERKLAVAQRIHDIVTGEFGLPPELLIFDALTFTLATGEEEFRHSAIDTIEGIRGIKAALPGVLLSLGVSNVSFGLGREARAVLNSVFLYHCVQAGLDMAIVNPSDITPYPEIGEEDRRLADDLVFDRDPQALARYIAHFEGRTPDARAREEEAEEATLPVERKIHFQILHRKPAGIEALVDEAVARRDPVEFGAGELILPFVLQSAEVMKKAVARLETYLEKNADVSKGRIVLATVYGDVHDIGKNLVKTILSNNGYTVFDLGKQVPVTTILQKAKEVEATAIGLSALLVSTSKQMPICVAELHRAGLSVPVLIGGAAINRNFGRRAALVDGEVFYPPGVYYCKDAFEGLDTVDALVHPDKRPALVERTRREAFEFKTRAAELDARAQDSAAAQQDFRVEVDRNVTIPVPPFWGPRVTEAQAIDWDGMFAAMDLKTLYRLHWGARGSGPEVERLLREDFEPRRLALQREARAQGWLAPRACFGYFPCQSDGPDLIVYDPAAFAPGALMPRGKIEEVVRFTFPRQTEREGLCLSDYFLPRSTSRFDVVAFQVVTVGPGADALGEALNARGEYAQALFTHGLAVSAAEGLAEWHHARIRRELGLEADRGKRYSFGYSACPELADQAKLFQLLAPERAIGVTLTSAYQLVPEASTSAIVVHHPAAMYYMVKV
ncbi:MAG: methionine synthase [Candidatus Eisenbacteria bacterium]|uniref:Methionine synthase n=1 Tax=Eiseniibacteriota bacterium TaxID=2212470 RepID=A0A538UBM5_UNCEI|nr:MAG: methionine synthase [Candidatus Eisenbacteria bacterium]